MKRSRASSRPNFTIRWRSKAATKLCGSTTSPVSFFFFSSRRRNTRSLRDWSSDVCSSDLAQIVHVDGGRREQDRLLENPQGFARARDLALRGAGPVGGLLAVEKRLRHREAGAARSVGAVNFSSDDRGRRAAGRGIRIGVLV